jgi:phospholipid/cholesterol/gamma-HCH transport system substrate-binding protein
MKITRSTEIGVGLFVCLGIAALAMLSLKVANLNSGDSAHAYPVRAYFDNVGGLQVRAPVKMGGVLIGRVAKIGYAAARFQAEVELRIDPAFDKIPSDTVANIYTAGLLGEQYISLEPGGADTFLQAGAEIEITQSALILERTLQEFIYTKTSKSEDSP